MWELRLGDEIDDYCVKCRRLTNHLVVSLVDGNAAKVRCRSCYADHDYRKEQAPPSKKELAKQKALFDAVLAGIAPAEGADPVLELEVAAEIETVEETLREEKPPAKPNKKKKA